MRPGGLTREVETPLASNHPRMRPSGAYPYTFCNQHPLRHSLSATAQVFTECPNGELASTQLIPQAVHGGKLTLQGSFTTAETMVLHPPSGHTP
jgi:hypothetical protein